MGKLNVAMLRYLTREDFRVLTAVSIIKSKISHKHSSKNMWYCTSHVYVCTNRLKWE